METLNPPGKGGPCLAGATQSHQNATLGVRPSCPRVCPLVGHPRHLPLKTPQAVRGVCLSCIKSFLPTDFWFYTEYSGEKEFPFGNLKFGFAPSPAGAPSLQAPRPLLTPRPWAAGPGTPGNRQLSVPPPPCAPGRLCPREATRRAPGPHPPMPTMHFISTGGGGDRARLADSRAPSGFNAALRCVPASLRKPGAFIGPGSPEATTRAGTRGLLAAWHAGWGQAPPPHLFPLDENSSTLPFA